MKFNKLKTLIDVAAGRKPADLVIKNSKIVNVFTGEITSGEIAIHSGMIAGIGKGYKGLKEIDAEGKYIAPGLIDGHVHVESSMVTPIQFSNAVVPKGTTTIIADPHEIANVCGIKGIDFMLKCSEKTPLDVYYMVPSCVPATSFETSGATIDSKEIEKLMDNEKILGLGEFMNYPGVVSGDREVLNKIAAAGGKPKDGHAPMLTGRRLNAYVASGITTDHECSTVEEMQEKLRLGMYVQIREGSAARNLEALIKGVNKDNLRRCIFCTDDRHLDDIEEGHIDNNIRLAIKNGIDPIDAIRMATLNTAECYKLDHVGAIAPCYNADLILFDNLKDFKIQKVFKAGELVAENGRILNELKIDTLNQSVLNTVKLPDINENKLKIKLLSDNVNVISIVPNELITKKVQRNVEQKDGFYKQTDNNILKIAVVERHKGTGNIGLGLIENFGLKNGAIATSIGHDSHNILAVGDNDTDMVTAIRELGVKGGGITICKNGKILKTLSLPIAGLMSDKPYKEVVKDLGEMLKIAREMGVNKKIDPFITLSFMALPVIPEIRITDKGLFDVTKFDFMKIEAQKEKKQGLDTRNERLNI